MREGEQLISAALEELRQLGTSGCSEQIVKYVPPIGTGCGCPDQRLWKPGLCSAFLVSIDVSRVSTRFRESLEIATNETGPFLVESTQA